MAAAFDHAAAVHHDQAVEHGDGGQAVRDGDDRLAFHQGVELLLDGGLDFRVQRRGRFVQHQDRCVLQQHARDRHALALAAGELHPALAHLGVVAAAALGIGQPADELVRMRAP